jgi:Domain of unknown function (DUF4253)
MGVTSRRVANPQRRRVRARLVLVQREDWRVEVEIATSEPLQDFQYRPEFGGYVERPVEYLNRMPSSFSITCVGSRTHGSGWRYVRVAAEAIVDGMAQGLVGRYLDLSDGSEERRLFELMCEQSAVRVWWVNEGVQVLRSYPPIRRAEWKEALANTRRISVEAWQEELEELAWLESESWRPGPRPRKHKRRTAKPPEPPLPFFARRSGAIPRAGAPELAGVKLPPGRRYPRGLPVAYWVSEEPVPNVEQLARSLLAVFPDTGLWPLLWRFDENPDSYMDGHGNLDAIGEVDVREVLREGWAHAGFNTAATEPFTEFPGLAPGIGYSSAGDAACPTEGDANDDAARMLLVPCNRPADTITALGGLACEVDPPVISAVLRSWEQRFAATAYEVSPSLVKLRVAAPPATLEHALLLAAEHMAFCPPENAGEPGALRDLANRLLTGELLSGRRQPGQDASRNRWNVGWYD